MRSQHYQGLSEIYAKKGIPVLACYKIYHDLVHYASDGLSEIAKCFGNDLVVLGALDRKKLGEIVFSNREKLGLLNEISHRHVFAELKKNVENFRKEGAKACIIDAPMLYEAKLDQYCDLVIAVISDEKKQRADYTLENNHSCEKLSEDSLELLKIILNEKENRYE